MCVSVSVCACMCVCVYIYIYNPTTYTSQPLGPRLGPPVSPQMSKSPPNECPGYDIKQSDGEAPVILEV